MKTFIRQRTTSIDSWAFTLHYKFTTGLLLASSILVFAKEHFGDPINCIPLDGVPLNRLNRYCWIDPTFSLPNDWEKLFGIEVPYPGVDKYTPGETRSYHTYYQGVWSFLFLAAILFYIPRYFWKLKEGGRIERLILGLYSPPVSDKSMDTNRKLIVQHFLSTYRHNGSYFLYFLIAEILNFVNVFGLIFLTDKFVEGQFTTYGMDVIRFSVWNSDVQFKVFPRTTKCMYYRFSSLGKVQRYDSICFLPINYLNERIFIILWFWFVILAVISGLNLIYRFVLIRSKDSRLFSIKSPFYDSENLDILVKRFALGDWLMLQFLAKNVDPLDFRYIVDDLADGLKSS